MDSFEQQMWQTLASYDAAGQTDQAKGVADQIKAYRTKQASGAQPGGPVQRSSAPELFPGSTAFGNAVADNLTFGLLPAAADFVGGQVANWLNKSQTPDQAVSTGQQMRNMEANDHPIANALGTIGGMAGNVAALSAAAPEALAMQAGKPFVNALKMAGYGGTASGVTTATHGGNASDIMNATAAGAILGPVAGKAASLVGEQIAPAASKAWRLFARKLGITPDDLMSYMQRYTGLTGQKPSIAQLMNAEGSGAIRAFASKNPIMTAEMQAARAEAQQAMPKAVTDIIDKAAAPPAPSFLASVDPKARSPFALNNALDSSMDVAMSKIESNTVQVPIELMKDQQLAPQFWKGVPRAMRKDLADAFTAADAAGSSDVPMTLRQLDTIRRKLRGFQKSPNNIGEEYGYIADELATAGAADPAYASALEEYAKGAKFIQGFEHSFGSGASADTATEASLRAALLTPEGKAGQQAGYQSYIRNTASQDPAAATKVASDLSSNTAEGKAFAQTTTPYGAARTQQATEALTKAAESQAKATPSRVNPDISAAAAGESALMGVGEAAAGLHLAGYGRVLRSFTSLISKTELPDAVQRDIGRAITSNDPVQVKAAIDQLRKATKDLAGIRKLAAVIAAEMGVKVGELLSPSRPTQQIQQ